MTTATASQPRFAPNASSGWLARRWYYTPGTHRAYSVRQISPGDRRLLAEFVWALDESSGARDQHGLRELSDMLFDHVLVPGSDPGSVTAMGFAALEATEAGDRIIGVAAYAARNHESRHDSAAFGVGVLATHRGEQVGHTLLATLVRQARRVGVRCLSAEMLWSNRPMQMLAQSLGFTVEPVASDRNLRRLMLALK